MYVGNASAGLQAVKSYSGAGHTGVIKQFAIADGDTNSYFKGTPVKLTGTATPGGIPFVTLADPGDDLVGAVGGFRYIPSRLPPNYLPQGPGFVMVYVDPHMEFVIGAPMDIDIETATDNNFNLTAEVGDACYGFSTVEIDPATQSADETGQVRILRRLQAPYGMVSGYCDTPDRQYLVVRINCHQYTNKLAGV